MQSLYIPLEYRLTVCKESGILNRCNSPLKISSVNTNPKRGNSLAVKYRAGRAGGSFSRYLLNTHYQVAKAQVFLSNFFE